MIGRKQFGSYFHCLIALCLFFAPRSSGQVRGITNNESRAREGAANPVARNARTPSSSISATENWLPPDIDRVIPPVGAGVACSLPTVLQGAGQRIQELVKNVDRFTATEVLSHQEVDRSGKPGRPTVVKFDYLVSMTESHDGYMTVDELRDRGRSLDRFPAHIATTGTPSLVLIFHPHYIGDFKTIRRVAWPACLAGAVRATRRPRESNVYVCGGRKGVRRKTSWKSLDPGQLISSGPSRNRPYGSDSKNPP
jgi:hypothetical protein